MHEQKQKYFFRVILAGGLHAEGAREVASYGVVTADRTQAFSSALRGENSNKMT